MIHTKENPGSAGGATGAEEFKRSIRSLDYRLRSERATTLCMAIADCHLEDAAPILEAALISMTAGQPVPALLSIMDAAAWWADFALPMELDAYALACVNRMAAPRRTAFLNYVGRSQ
jgi:hypothetical protein